eukprot:SAG22_NODE_390_length_11235_cov_26.293732_5_plen_158_part_00
MTVPRPPPSLPQRTSGAPNSEWAAAIHELAAASAGVYVKVSALSQMVPGGNPPQDLDPPQDPQRLAPAHYAPLLDVLWDAFGPSRLIYASNWPQIEARSTFRDEFEIVKTYFERKGEAASAAFFAGNARAVYRWDLPSPKPPVSVSSLTSDPTPSRL